MMKASKGRMRRIEKARDKAQKRRLKKALKGATCASQKYRLLYQLHDLIHKHDPVYQRMKLRIQAIPIE
jgi:hypothetical protein